MERTFVDIAFPGKSVNTQYGVTGYFAATTFTATGSGNLASIVIALSQPSGSAPIPVGLYTDTYGEPGTLLESWVVPVNSNLLWFGAGVGTAAHDSCIGAESAVVLRDEILVRDEPGDFE